jgi:hypothetical protein
MAAPTAAETIPMFHQLPPPAVRLDQYTPSSFSAHRASFIQHQQQQLEKYEQRQNQQQQQQQKQQQQAPQHTGALQQHHQPLQQQQLAAPPPGPHRSNDNKQQASTAFADKLRHMALPIAPLVQLTTGAVHPRFPDTILAFWLLTDGELEALAHFYHQSTPGRWSAHYPCPILWDSAACLEDKRRRIGRFIGLRGCDSPAAAAAAAAALAAAAAWRRSEEEIAAEARRARERDDEEEVWRRKLPW